MDWSKIPELLCPSCKSNNISWAYKKVKGIEFNVKCNDCDTYFQF